MPNQKSPSTISPGDFLNALFPDLGDGLQIEMRAFKNGSTVVQEFHPTITGVVKAAQQLAPERDVYFAVNPRRGRNGTKAGVAQVGALHADLDKPRNEAVAALKRFPVKPSIIIDSGYGLHGYWLLQEPYAIEGDEDAVAFIEGLNKGIAAQLGGDAAHDVSRILRLPGTVNHKNGAQKPVRVLRFKPTARYALEDFEPYRVDVRPGGADAATFSGVAGDGKKALRRAKRQGLAARSLTRITAGHRAETDRSRTDYRVVCDLLRAGMSDDDVRAIFTHYPIGIVYREEGDHYLALSIGNARAELRESGELPSAERKSLPERRAALDHAKGTVARWLKLDDPSVVDVVLAVPVANAAEGDPVWVIVIAGSSSAKSELLRGLNRCPQVYAISALTDRTFVSGFGNPSETSLLAKIRSGQTLLFKDFGSILSMRPDSKAEVLAQLREIYDGQYAKSFGTGKQFKWQGHLGFLTASTPAIERHHAVLGELGERFLWFRLSTPAEDRAAVADLALEDAGQEKIMRQEIAESFLQVIGDIDPAECASVACPPELKRRIGAVANFATWLRTPVVRERYTSVIEYTPAPEGPARMAKALLRMGRALATVRGQDAIDGQVAELLVKIATDSVPPQRLAAVRWLHILGQSAPSQDIGMGLGVPTSTATKLLEDLTALGVLRRTAAKRKDGEKGTTRNTRYLFRLRGSVADLLEQVDGEEGGD